jgi:transposase
MADRSPSTKALYATILGLPDPWEVVGVDLAFEKNEVHVTVAVPEKTRWGCPDCEDAIPTYDHRDRTWRHLDTCQLQTFVHARVPRVQCPKHGVRQVRVPWAEDGSRFTALFEAMVIGWLREASIQAVAKRIGLTWDQAMGVMKRAVARGQARQGEELVRYFGIDETSEKRGHEYLTIVSDLERTKVLFVDEDRKTETLDRFWASLSRQQLEAVEAVAMDMWQPYINSTREHLPGAEEKIVFDKFHIAQHLNNAIDEVRKAEHRELMAEGKDWLKGTKYLWLRNPEKLVRTKWREFLALARSHSFRTGRAWAIVQTFMAIFDYSYPGVAAKHFKKWYQWARRSKLEPIKKVARMIHDHWPNIFTYFRHRITNAGSESINSLIQKVKRKAHGFRNSENFKTAILFHLGGLDLMPTRLQSRATL